MAILVGEATNGFRSGGGRHNIEIDIAPDLPWVMADRLRMVQVLGNLLTNAARHSPQSSVIQVTAVRAEVHVAVSVSDHGRGIPAESLPHLFRKFSRIESQEQGGDTGLGLAICKGIVEALGAASGPRATGRAWAQGSHSPCRPSRRPGTFLQPGRPSPRPAPHDDGRRMRCA